MMKLNVAWENNNPVFEGKSYVNLHPHLPRVSQTLIQGEGNPKRKKKGFSEINYKKLKECQW